MAKNNALNISRLAKYNFKFISIEEVILLEYFLNYYQKNQLSEIVPSRIEAETGIKRSRIDSTVSDLKEKGFVDSKIEKFRTFYSIDIEKIISSLPKLFVKSSKYSYQYIYFVQNPGGFKKKPGSKISKKEAAGKPKTKQDIEPKQMSLF
ncbi:MAG: hypothetical protein SFY32_05385 [Bacteroidota bacterium]|nr:hypothetical protein [Bacteroidota bacterium]